MSLKTALKRMIPSFRVETALHNEIQDVQSKEIRTQDIIDKRWKALSARLDALDNKTEFMFWLSQMRDGETMEETKQRVFLNMPKATGQLRDIQLAENYILQYIKDICDKNGLSFWLSGGTALGAVRHHGFIPWDDDVDIGMWTQDCDLLIELLRDDSIISVRRYYQKIGGSVVKAKFREYDSIFVDIFTYERVDCSPTTYQQCVEESQKCVHALTKQFAVYMNSEIESSDRPIYSEHIQEQFESIYAEHIAKLPFRIGEGSYFCMSIKAGAAFWDHCGVKKVSDYYPLEKDSVVFEGRSYNVRKNNIAHLMKSYGDIWSMPRSITNIHSEEFAGVEKELEALKMRGIL